MAEWQRSTVSRLRSIRIVLAAALALAACSEVGSRAGVHDPMAEHLNEALEIAHEEWEASWKLDLVGSRFEPDDGALVRKDIAYVFVSDDVSYYLVRFHTDGSVSSGPVAGIARAPIEVFDFAETEISSDEALDVAWETLGERLVERCGPLRWLNVNGRIGSESRQVWSVSYRSTVNEHTIWLDAVSGEVVEIEEAPC